MGCNVGEDVVGDSDGSCVGMTDGNFVGSFVLRQIPAVTPLSDAPFAINVADESYM